MKPPRKQSLVEIVSSMMRANLSRRTILAAGGLATLTAAARAAGGFGNPDLPAEGAVNVTNPKALTDPGPQDPGLAGFEPAFLTPPATDVSGLPQEISRKFRKFAGKFLENSWKFPGNFRRNSALIGRAGKILGFRMIP